MEVDDELYNIRVKLHHVWYLVSRTLFAKEINCMSRGSKVSYMLIAKFALFVNINNYFK
jgi:hypothetical protein